MSDNSKLRKLNILLDKVKGKKAEIEALSDDELSGMTEVFRNRLNSGETLADILPEAFAAICEADKRILGLYPYDVQILGGLAMNQGYLAEMNTGEGKTLTATMPLYLNALTGKSAILMTTNDYLACRDAEEMGKVYKFMGLTISVGVVGWEKGRKKDRFTNKEKKAIYASDIVYTTHGAFGFDYLFDNLVTKPEDRFLRELNYVIIDEADQVLLDSAQTPLVISGAPRVQSNLYELADFFVTTLREKEDYETEDKKVWLTAKGVEYAQRFFEIDNFYSRDNFEINRHVNLALRAHVIFENEKDYVVSDGKEIILLDKATGRMMPGVKLRGGMHQAIETKEKLKASTENRSVAAITYQNLFQLFPKMSGMSGTISDARDELLDLYGEDIVVIPTNKPVIREDMPDLYFHDSISQFMEAINCAEKYHDSGRPVLIVVSSIADTEAVSSLLMEKSIPHSVLNANNEYWEAEIIRVAGKYNAVTVATSMAGRGTDIKLDQKSRELGGLAVIGIGRMENVRGERQARGRAGRQGDPGMSRFYVSLEDEVVTQNGKSNIDRYINGEKHIGKYRLKKIINSAQRLTEDLAVKNRRQVMDYDEVMKRQRTVIYSMRDKLLNGNTTIIEDRSVINPVSKLETGIDKNAIIGVARENIRDFIKTEKTITRDEISRYLMDNISYIGNARSLIDGHEPDNKNVLIENLDPDKKKDIERFLMKRVRDGLKSQEMNLGKKSRLREFLRVATLTAIDDAWVEEVDYLNQLQAAVSGRASAQRNLVFEYQKEARYSFDNMEKTIKKNIMRNVLLSSVYVDEKYNLHIILP